MSMLIIPDIAEKGGASSMGKYMRWESILGIAVVLLAAKGAVAGFKSFQGRTSQAIATPVTETSTNADALANTSANPQSPSPTSRLASFPSSVQLANDSEPLPDAAPAVKLIANATVQTPKSTQSLTSRYTTIEDAEVWVPVLYEQEDFARIEKTITELLARDRQDEQASAYLGRLYSRLGELQGRDYKITASDRTQFQRQLAVLDRWQAASPDSHIPLLIRGQLKTDYAWEIRGSSYSYKVTRENAAEYAQEIQKAIIDLKRATELKPEDPNTWSTLMMASRGVSEPSTLRALYEKGLEANPYHLDLHAQWAYFLKPQWYGSVEEQIAFAKEMSQLSKDKNRPMLGTVALATYRTCRRYREELLKDPSVKADIKVLYENIFEAYPEAPRMRFYYAYDAFQLGQFDVALEQFEWIGDRWANNVSFDDVEEFNRVRAVVYYKAAHDAFLRRDAEATKRLADFSNDLLPTPGVFLLLAALSGNTDPDMTKVIAYVEQALALNPTELEKREAQRMIQQAEAMMGGR